nr:NAD(P)/FAD-dependent oxidoreductase [Chloroflexota bacterium]
MSFDLAVIGGGPAGVSAALRARELGATAALVERTRLGGTCTNDGCVPTRVLAHVARLVRDAEQFRGYGLTGASPGVDFPAVLARTREMVEAVHAKKQLEQHLADAGVQLIPGAARFVDPRTLETDAGQSVRASSFVICVGGHPRRLAFPGADLALTHSDVWSLQGLPGSIVIVGGAATGCQLASVFAAFGSAVTLLELAPRLLPNEDAAVSSALTAALGGRGIALHTGIDGVDSIERAGRDGRLTLHYRDGGTAATVEA